MIIINSFNSSHAGMGMCVFICVPALLAARVHGKPALLAAKGYGKPVLLAAKGYGKPALLAANSHVACWVSMEFGYLYKFI